MKTKRIILFLAAAALFTGCFKDVSYKTTYVFKPLEQEKSGDPTQILADAKLYAFAADTSSWEVASYKDALAGVISQRGNRNEKISTPLATGEPYEQEGVEGLLQMSFDRSSVMVVAVDTKNELYGYTQQEVPENTPKIYVTLIFKRWKQGYSYKDGKWLMFNDSYTPPIYIDSHVTAQLQAEEGAEPTVPSNLRVYAYAVDTTAWKINSYNDAAQRIITSKSDPKQTRTSPDFEAYYSKESVTYGMKVSSPTLMVVVTDPVNQLYAYSQQEVEIVEGGQPVNFLPVVFRPWKQEYLYVEEGGWRVVNDKLAPKEPEKASKR